MVVYITTGGTGHLNYFIPLTKPCKMSFHSWKNQIFIFITGCYA